MLKKFNEMTTFNKLILVKWIFLLSNTAFVAIFKLFNKSSVTVGDFYTAIVIYLFFTLKYKYNKTNTDFFKRNNLNIYKSNLSAIIITALVLTASGFMMVTLGLNEKLTPLQFVVLLGSIVVFVPSFYSNSKASFVGLMIGSTPYLIKFFNINTLIPIFVLMNLSLVIVIVLEKRNIMNT